MDSIEDEELSQMVRDFIESEDCASSSSSSRLTLSSSTAQKYQTPDHRHHRTYSALKGVVENETEAEGDVLKRVLKHLRAIKRDRDRRSSGGCCDLKKWLVTRLKMEDGFHASLCHSSWATSFARPGGDYEYIAISMKDEKKSVGAGAGKQGQGRRLIVDIDFKSQFEVARPTQSYKELMDALPSIFVGDEAKLDKIISLLCSAARASLTQSGLHIPPWRTAGYMYSKWALSHK